MPEDTLSSAEIELLIVDKIESTADKIAGKCVERIKHAQHDCEAFRIFRDKDNIHKFYNTEKKIEDHINSHKKKEIEDNKRYDKKFRLILIISAIINMPNVIYGFVKIWM